MCLRNTHIDDAEIMLCMYVAHLKCEKLTRRLSFAQGVSLALPYLAGVLKKLNASNAGGPDACPTKAFVRL